MLTNGTALEAAESLRNLWQAQAITGATSDMVYAILHEAILSGILPPGQRLGEELLAALFDVSRTPVREALLRLETTGLAHRVPRRGLIVARITPEEIVEVYVVRENLDGLAAHLAAQVATPSDVAILIAINEEFARAARAGDVVAMADLNLQFHEAVARVARNSLLSQFLTQIHHHVRRIPGTTFQHPGRAASAVEEHASIIEAIQARDAERARQLATESMATARRIRIAMLGQGVEDVATSQ
jgi:DNA-binding GntR family transcriptional regulator